MDFNLIEKIGSSLSADIYKACHPSEGKTLYRVKIIKRPFFDTALLKHLRQQLSYLEQLEIKGLQLPELIEDNNTVFLKQPFLPQKTLSKFLEEKKTLNPKQTIKLGISLCEQLENRHEKTWVHKHIKPNNILYSTNPNAITLIDDLEVTSAKFNHLSNDPGYIKESMPYQSPEQNGRIRTGVDHRSDLYSLGCVLYHCIAGVPPNILQ